MIVKKQKVVDDMKCRIKKCNGVVILNKKKRSRVTILSDKGRQEYRCIDKDGKDTSFRDLMKESL